MLDFTEYRPAGTFTITKRPWSSVAAPSGAPITITLAPASGCFFASRTTPEILPVVPAAAIPGRTASHAHARTRARPRPVNRDFMSGESPSHPAGRVPDGAGRAWRPAPRLDRAVERYRVSSSLPESVAC